MTPERAQAIKEGKQFYEGVPCRKAGHTTRYTTTGGCAECSRVYNKERAKTAEHKKQMREYQKKNNQTEHRKKYMREYMAKYRQENNNEKKAQDRYTEKHREAILERQKRRYYHKKAIQTPAEKAAESKRRAEYRRKRLAKLSPEELKAYKEKMAAYQVKYRQEKKQALTDPEV